MSVVCCFGFLVCLGFGFGLWFLLFCGFWCVRVVVEVFVCLFVGFWGFGRCLVGWGGVVCYYGVLVLGVVCLVLVEFGLGYDGGGSCVWVV